MTVTINHRMVPMHTDKHSALVDLCILTVPGATRRPTTLAVTVQSSVPPLLSKHGKHRRLTHRRVRRLSTTSIIAPPVSSGWFLAPVMWRLDERSPWARPSSRSGPPSPPGSPETSRSSTLGFSGRNLKHNIKPDTLLNLRLSALECS